jgi:dTDP-N-acetylfucosamine:lipid II N-acetylfucosaminyltransferase
VILHIMTLDKFLPPFIDFLNKHFDTTQHKFVFINDKEYKYGLNKNHDVEFLNTDKELKTVLTHMQNSSKIILHGLWRDRITLLLLKNPPLIKKCYWVMWGGDFYFPQKQNSQKKELIQQLPYLVTGTAGEVAYVRENYGAIGEHIEAFVYTSNLHKEIKPSIKKDATVRILVGNSANPTNNHKEVLDKLFQYKDEDIEIFMPLSYGDFKYGMQIMKYGYENFGKKFQPIVDFMDEEEYYAFLSTIDIGMFNHNRQQGMGNIITLLGMGKKVYMRSNVTTWAMFKENSIKLFDMSDINVDLLNEIEQIENILQIKKYFSVQNFKKQLCCLFDEEGS